MFNFGKKKEFIVPKKESPDFLGDTQALDAVGKEILPLIEDEDGENITLYDLQQNAAEARAEYDSDLKSIHGRYEAGEKKITEDQSLHTHEDIEAEFDKVVDEQEVRNRKQGGDTKYFRKWKRTLTPGQVHNPKPERPKGGEKIVTQLEANENTEESEDGILRSIDNMTN